MTPLDDPRVKALWADPNFQVMCDVDKVLHSSRIWNGMGWTYHPIPVVKYEKLIPQVREALDRIKEHFGVESE